jgi:acetamidase/formamidase
MKRVERDPEKFRYVFSNKFSPILEVRPGEEFTLETEDAFGGKIKQNTDLPVIERLSGLHRMPPYLNPLVGPVYIDGAARGDVVVVDIHEIEPQDEGVTVVVKGFGPLADSASWPECHGPHTRVLPYERGSSGKFSDGQVIFNERLSWPMSPFMGCIGVAPDFEEVSSLVGPYDGQATGGFGGNWDSRDVKQGNRIYLPVYNEGALLYLGDMHASQGDAEWTGTAVETRGELRVSCELIKKKIIPYPRIETPRSIIQLNNGRPLERSISQAWIWMMSRLVDEFKFSQIDAYQFISCCPDARIHVYQMIPDNWYTVGVEIPKAYLM